MCARSTSKQTRTGHYRKRRFRLLRWQKLLLRRSCTCMIRHRTRPIGASRPSLMTAHHSHARTSRLQWASDGRGSAQGRSNSGRGASRERRCNRHPCTRERAGSVVRLSGGVAGARSAERVPHGHMSRICGVTKFFWKMGSQTPSVTSLAGPGRSMISSRPGLRGFH